MSQSYDTLRVTPSADGYVVTVEMHRPEALNAMNTAMGRELLQCFEDFFWDKQTRVVILTGAGAKAFCVGGDLKERQGMSDEAWREQHVIFEQAAFRILRCPLPVIAAVEGFAILEQMKLISDAFYANHAKFILLRDLVADPVALWASIDAK